VTFSSAAAICRYLARAAVSSGGNVSLYGSDILQQAEVRLLCWVTWVFVWVTCYWRLSITTETSTSLQFHRCSNLSKGVLVSIQFGAPCVVQVMISYCGHTCNVYSAFLQSLAASQVRQRTINKQTHIGVGLFIDSSLSSSVGIPCYTYHRVCPM